MGQLEKAVDLYMRGFNNTYVKRRTGWSHQRVRKHLAAAGVRHDNHAIMAYQVAYIRDKYDESAIAAAYHDMLQRHDDPFKATRGRHVVFLGCGFGAYDNVLREVLGAEAYRALTKPTSAEMTI